MQMHTSSLTVHRANFFRSESVFEWICVEIYLLQNYLGLSGYTMVYRIFFFWVCLILSAQLETKLSSMITVFLSPSLSQVHVHVHCDTPQNVHDRRWKQDFLDQGCILYEMNILGYRVSVNKIWWMYSHDVLGARACKMTSPAFRSFWSGMCVVFTRTWNSGLTLPDLDRWIHMHLQTHIQSWRICDSMLLKLRQKLLELLMQHNDILSTVCSRLKLCAYFILFFLWLVAENNEKLYMEYTQNKLKAVDKKSKSDAGESVYPLYVSILSIYLSIYGYIIRYIW